MPFRIVFVLLILTLLIALLLGALGGLRMRRVLESRESRRRTKHGLAAERAAEKLLVRLGYRVLGRQVAGTYEALVDGAPWQVSLTADLLVERDGRELVAEVKTGANGTRIGYADTRRQMLEYQLAFGVDAVLLVDGDAGTVSEVRFPLEAPARASMPASTRPLVVLAFVVLAAVAFAWVRYGAPLR